ncbi:hypothetical protein [Klenkia brasiliensis]|uniref:Uncharacterized protein n=1 Tax=Klenkia brasiliensis TaxID=333142 RepID=A0A1G7WD09_9ACTN|nr:hypothetical protein [Klenkia brasiliensis]SDG69882.1 hypothetical protein SAMN05660324_3284 [Klenkia brasiliensis]
MTDPLRLAFAEVHRSRPRALVSPFGRVHRPGPLHLVPGARTDLGSAPPAPFWAVTADVARIDPGAGVALGVAGPGGSVLLRRAPDGDRWLVEVSGVVVCSAPLPPEPAHRVAVVGNENQVTVLTAPAGSSDEGSWRPLVTEREAVRRVLDLRRADVLAGLRFVVEADGTGTVELADLLAGSFGAAGVRDPQVVTTTDGRPLVRDGRLLLTMTCAGLGFFQQAHWGVWALDPADPGSLEQVGELFSRRDGLVLGDHAGHVVVDEDTGVATVLVSTWGDHDPGRGVHVRAVRTTADVLLGTHVLGTERVDLPTEVSAWDPTLARVGGRWHLGFVECPSFGPPRYEFHPALAATDDPDPLRGLRRVGGDPGRSQTEGTVWQRFGDGWYLLASDGDARTYPVYDAQLRERGLLQAPYGTNIPHPMVVPAAGAWWVVTFDGTPWGDDVLGYGTHGDLVVMRADPPGRPSLRARAGAVRRRLTRGA